MAHSIAVAERDAGRVNPLNAVAARHRVTNAHEQHLARWHGEDRRDVIAVYGQTDQHHLQRRLANRNTASLTSLPGRRQYRQSRANHSWARGVSASCWWI